MSRNDSYGIFSNPGVQAALVFVAAVAFGAGIAASKMGLVRPAGAGGSGPVTSPAGVAQDDIACCFSPKGGCEQAIAEQINQAHQSLHVQAYSFTSRPISEAMVAARKRGVQVTLILDKGDGEYSEAAGNVLNAGCTVYIDPKHAIAHNKVMLIDGRTLITGSFNFTYSAEHSNAENVLILHDKRQIYDAYERNFQSHQAHSDPISPGQMKISTRGRGHERF